MAAADSRPSVLLIGGLGFIGRFAAKYIHDNALASEIRIVDKALPELAMLAPEFAEACSRDHFMQGDLARESTAAKVFDRENGGSWDYVFNCGGDSGFSGDNEVYKKYSLALSTTAAKEAGKRGVKCWVELSTGAVYKPGSGPHKEGDKIKPWTRMAEYKSAAEEELQNIPGLKLLVLRLPVVYGEYCSKKVGTMLCMARVYAYLDEEMKWLWTKDMRTHTVHVKDVARAMWTAAEWYAAGRKGLEEGTPVFNIVDHGDSTQGSVQELIGRVFSIETGFHGKVISQFAKLNIYSAVDEENDELLQPWSHMLTEAGIDRPGPITPYLDPELVKDSDLSLDGSLFEKVTGFNYETPKLTEEGLKDIIKSYERQGWWPTLESKAPTPE